MEQSYENINLLIMQQSKGFNPVQPQRLKALRSHLQFLIDKHKKGRTTQATYRSKANKIYKDKLKKVFKPSQMEEYKDILKFESYFPIYLHQSTNINLLKEEEQKYVNTTPHEESKRDLFQIMLTQDIDKLGPLFQSLNLNKPSRIYPQSQRRQLKQTSQVINSLESSNSKYKQKKNSFIERNYSKSYQSPGRQMLSPSKRLKRLRSNQGNCIQKEFVQVDRKYVRLNQEELINSLNQINSYHFTQQSFQITSQKFHINFSKFHGNQIFTNYYHLPQNLNFTIVAETLTKIITSTKLQQLMLLFLNLDINKDGFICEHDLFYLSSKLSSNHTIQYIISSILQFSKSPTYALSQQRELPKQFFSNPDYKLYKQLFENRKSPQRKQKKLPLINKKNRYFILDDLETEREKPTFCQMEKIQKNNLIRINFKVFQQFFSQDSFKIINGIIQLFTKTNQEIKITHGNLTKKNSLSSSQKKWQLQEPMQRTFGSTPVRKLQSRHGSVQFTDPNKTKGAFPSPFSTRKYRSITQKSHSMSITKGNFPRTFYDKVT